MLMDNLPLWLNRLQRRKVMLRMGVDSLLVMLLYLGGVALLFALR